MPTCLLCVDLNVQHMARVACRTRLFVGSFGSHTHIAQSRQIQANQNPIDSTHNQFAYHWFKVFDP